MTAQAIFDKDTVHVKVANLPTYLYLLEDLYAFVFQFYKCSSCILSESILTFHGKLKDTKKDKISF